MIKIRKAKSSDSERIVELQLKMAQETEGMALNRDVVIKGVSGVFQEPARGTYWVVEEKDKVLGVLLAIPEWSDWRNGTVLWIHSLYVVPEARGRGVFKELYLNLKKQVEQSSELVGLRLYVDKQNKSAKTIYEKLGMSRDHYELYEWLK
ncbi:MAG: GNAT family N-acetyltransferase [Phycisphaerae bacterium]|nr:GNAT family N-acetyltransferase [Phycisphaerae bacterium]NIP52971.1 GNAT family N-acetyltransferase [Phycisphaerae bacterium]NIS52941.1 GNAT family N-acetyltransferase [Phycisphaerae bacterium]NIU09536.1 GNAT family N-acetyltransferase [Phycisphaerae bacterium]NIU57206.1 GNAT family N-acetyltransferase [Phycisphaerae bacterium]